MTHKDSPLIIKNQIISRNNFSEASFSDAYVPYRSLMTDVSDILELLLRL